MASTKVVICGDGAIGKTCLLDTLYGTDSVNWDDPEYQPTAASNQLQTWEIDGLGDAQFEFWDTAGQEALEALRNEAYPGTNVLMIGFDTTNPDSLTNVVDNWVPEFKEHCSDCKAIILVGTKFDLFEERGGFDGDEGVKRADVINTAIQIGAAAVIMTSAKTKSGVVPECDGAEQDYTNSEDGANLKSEIKRLAKLLYDNGEIDTVVDAQAAKPEPAPAPAPEPAPAPVAAPAPAPVAAAPAAAPVAAAAPAPAPVKKDDGCCVIA
eukprot:TRINITY_DN1434_c0_g1_i1.p1 TRINITY_DN1434_c0_g1~~TRINITY_DN1434_c0_g1_i1.p1  ORF type:complete len:267 (-),score=62.90 TRINITY_DN1434_c0_g1_i1:245-1045(-)